MNRVDTATATAVLAAAFPTWKPTAETIEMWHAMLQDLDAGLVMAAVGEWVLTEEWPPSVAGIRRRCAALAGATSKPATEAWAEVSAQADEFGYENYGNSPRPPWSSDLVRRAVRAIGWWEICNGSNPTATRAQFIRAYEEMAAAADRETFTSRRFQPALGKVALPNSTAVEYRGGREALTEGDAQ